MEYRPKFASDATDSLVSAMLALETEEEAYRLMEDLYTINEIHAIAQRMAVAGMLHEGKTYHEIAENTGASTATISRVNRCLLYGANGYTQVLDKLGKKK